MLFMFLPESEKDINLDGYGGYMGIELTLRFISEVSSFLAKNGECWLLSKAPILVNGSNLLEDKLEKLAMQLHLDISIFVIGYSWVQAHMKFHKSHGKLVTITAVRPTARFGELEIEDSNVLSFKEKPQLQDGWINGGFFVVEPEFLEFIENDKTMFEREPLEKAARLGQLKAYKHNGFWQCMDTKRDKDALEKMWAEGNPRWCQ